MMIRRPHKKPRADLQQAYQALLSDIKATLARIEDCLEQLRNGSSK